LAFLCFRLCIWMCTVYFGSRLDLHCMLGFSWDLGFGTRRRILDFRLFLWFCFTSSGKPWAKGGVLTKDLARWLTAPIGLACPHQPHLPPPVSPAPTSLPCPHRPRLPLSDSLAPMARRTARHWYSALGSAFGSRHWVFLLSLSYIKSIVFLLFVSTDNSSSSPSSRVNNLHAYATAGEGDTYVSDHGGIRQIR
jgi:hypothetical protein